MERQRAFVVYAIGICDVFISQCSRDAQLFGRVNERLKYLLDLKKKIKMSIRAFNVFRELKNIDENLETTKRLLGQGTSESLQTVDYFLAEIEVG
jgi:hypothetical protein